MAIVIINLKSLTIDAYPNFSTSEIDSTSISNDIGLLNEEKLSEQIYNFDIDSQGDIAVAMGGSKNIVNIYNSDGEFLYGFCVKVNNCGLMYVEYIDDTLCIYDYRNEQIYTLKGKIFDSAYKIKFSDNQRWNELSATVKSHGEDTYYLSVGQILYKENNFEKSIIVDATSITHTKTAYLLTFFVLAIICKYFVDSKK
jgi:hypothetical protein